MAYRTYTVTVGKHKVNVKAKKADAKRFGSMLGRLVHLESFHREITGTVGKPDTQRSHVMQALFSKGAGEIEDKEAWRTETEELFASLPDPITYDNMGDIKSKADAIFDKYCPVVDKRRTPEEKQGLAQQAQARREKRETKQLEIVERYGETEKVKVPEGKSAVTIELTYNNSDIQSDYHASHRGHGPRFLLGVSNTSRRTEATARRFVERYPELKQLDWAWNVEDYSMGHGYWLESEPVTKLEGVTTYGGHKNPSARWEVKINKYAGGEEFYPFASYPGQDAPQVEKSSNGKVTVEHDRDWLWVYFPEKPSEETLDALKGLGGRWSRKRKGWYFTNAEAVEGEVRETVLPEGEAQ